MIGPIRAIRRKTAMLRLHFIDEWRSGWRFWSVRMQAMAVAVGAALTVLPGEMAQLWASLPPEARSALPPGVGRWAPVVLGLGAIVARFLKQGDKHHG